MEVHKPLRVLHILQRMEAGGTQALLMNIYRNIDRSKIQFDFLVEYPNKQFYDDEIISLGGKIYYTNVRNDLNIYKFEKELKKIIISNDYKIVHVHAYTIGYFCLKIAKKCNVPIRIAHSHNNETVHDFKYIPKLLLQRLYTIYATDLFACSDEAGKYLFKNKKFNIMRNAIDSKKFMYNEKIRNDIRNELMIQDNLVIGHVGRFHQQKNHKFLLDVFAKIREKRVNAKLLLIGTGPLEDEIKMKVNNLGLDNDVIFLGNRKDMCKIYQGMDIMIFPSIFEGFGIVTIEAQASGVPVLCSNNLPKEVEITPICKKLSLDESAEVWAEEALKLLEMNYSKESMQAKIIESGFDVSTTAMDIQNYYLNKINKKEEI